MKFLNLPAKKIRGYNAIVFVLIGIYFTSTLYALKKLSINSDEGSFYSYGVKILKDNPTKQDNLILFHSKMPVCALNALPRAIKQLFNPSLKKNQQQAFSDIYYGRFISVLIGFFIILYVFKWSRKLYGPNGGLFSLFLCCLCPNLIAHSQFVSADIYSVFFSIALFYHSWRYTQTHSFKQLTLMAVFLALCQVSKQSLLFYYFLIPLLLIAASYAASGNNFRKHFFSVKYFFSKKIITSVIWVIALNLIIINTAFLFYHTGKPLKEYHFISQPFQEIQQASGFLGSIPLPFPQPFFEGMDGAKYFEQLGGGSVQSTYGDVYLLGTKKKDGSFFYYYFVILFFKLPIPFLIAIIFSLFCIFRLQTIKYFFRNEAFIIIPIAVGLILFNFFYKAQIGIRHILFMLPLLQVLCGRFPSGLLSIWNKKSAFILIPFCSWQIISVMSYFPHFLPYTNEFILNKKNAYKYLADSNIFYKEGKYWLDKYIEQHPGSVYEPQKPIGGNIIVNVNDYLDLWNTGTYQWIHQLHKEPYDHINSQYLVFHISQEDIVRLSP